jgi:hypothetical protein
MNAYETGGKIGQTSGRILEHSVKAERNIDNTRFHPPVSANGNVAIERRQRSSSERVQKRLPPVCLGGSGMHDRRETPKRRSLVLPSLDVGSSEANLESKVHKRGLGNEAMHLRCSDVRRTWSNGEIKTWVRLGSIKSRQRIP